MSNISDQYPKAIEKLEEYLRITNKEINVNRVKTSNEVIMEFGIDLGKSFDDKSLILLNKIRVCLETMQFNIRTFNLTSTNGCSYVAKVDQFDDLEVNEPLLLLIDGNYGMSQNYMFVSRNKSKIVVKNTETLETSEFDSSLVYTMNHCINDCIKDIKLMAENRGMKNLLHMDRQPIIAEYAKQFADHYKKHMMRAIDAIAIVMSSFFDDLQKSVDNETAKILAKLHRNEMIALVEKCKAAANEAADAAYIHNAEPLLVFDSNDHYLSDLVSKMVAEDGDMASDDGGARHIYHNVRAYIKSQRKYISELATKEIMRTMYLGCKVGFEDSLKLLPKYSEQVKEPSHVTKRREQLEQRRNLLSDAIKVLRDA